MEDDQPRKQKVYRVYEKDSGKIKADLIALEDENLTSDKPLLLFDPMATWKKTYLKADSYTLRNC